jgi:hypothetical protein
LNLAQYQDAYKNTNIVVWLVRHKEFITMPKDAAKIELDFYDIRKIIQIVK